MTPLRSDWLADIVPLKAELDALRPLSQDALAQLQAHFDVELTWSSNAIEGNTLTLRETAEVIAHGITVGGKPLRDHLEAQDHHAALLWMRDLAAHDSLIGERTITELHRRIVLRSNPAIAGLYSPFPRRIAGSAAVFPNPAKVPYLMAELGAWLTGETPSLETALEAHWRLVAVHPFSDGNGRCARLLMNLILLRAGYPPVAVRPEDRAVYLAGLEVASLTGNLEDWHTMMLKRVRETLADYVQVLRP